MENNVKAKYYAVVGASVETTDSSKTPLCPNGYIEMHYERPSPEHIASETGEWVLPDVVDEEEIEDNKPWFSEY